MRLRILIALFFFLLFLGILGFAPIQIGDYVDDKLLHFVCFGLLGLCVYFVWDLDSKCNLVLTSAVLLVMAIGSEFVQGLLPYRTFDVHDIYANLAGATCGIGGAFLGESILTSYRENRRRRGGRHEAEDQYALMDDDDILLEAHHPD